MKKIILPIIAIGSLSVGSCKDKDKLVTPNKQQPIILDCDYFEKNPNTVLKDNPDADIDYIVTCKMKINDLVTIDPGATIAFEEQAGFVVESSGSLSAIGSQSKLITFTGVKKIKGAWSGIIIYSTKINNQISNAVIEYGGGGHFNSNKDSGCVIVFGNASLGFNNNKVSHSASFGIHATTQAGEISSFDNNVFENNQKPVKLHIEKIYTIGRSNTYVNNAFNKIESTITGNISENMTWKNLGIPYYFTASSLSSCVIAADLKIEPGTVFEMGSKTTLSIQPEGSLSAIGTADKPIVFKGEKSAPGYWGSIYLKNSSNPFNELRYVNLQDAGNESYGIKGGVYLWGSSAISIDYVNFKDITNCGIAGKISAITNSDIGNNITYNNTSGTVCPE